MKGFKKLLRLSGLGLLIFLASIGISISGGAPVPPSNKKENTIEIKSENAEPKKDDEVELNIRE